MTEVGFGNDIWCLGSMTSGKFARESTLVIQALYRRLITPRGMLRGGDEEAAYGIDLAGYVGSVGDEDALNALPGIVRAEFLKDDRVTTVLVESSSTTAADGTTSIELEITVTLGDDTDTYPFTITVTDITVELLGGT